MKKILIAFILTLAATSCGFDNSTIGIIGGADGPTTIVVASKADELKYVPTIDGLPTPPGDYNSASIGEGVTVIDTENVTVLMRDEYIAELTGLGFEMGVMTADEPMTSCSLMKDGMTVNLTLNEDKLTTVVTGEYFIVTMVD